MNTDITKNSESLLLNADLLSLEKELLSCKATESFVGGLFENMIDPPFKVFLKRIIVETYPDMKNYDIYDDENDVLFIDFIKKSGKQTIGIKSKDYLFDNTSYTLTKSVNLCFGIGGKKSSSTQEKPISRDNVLFVCFALNLNEKQANALLTKGLKQQGFNFKNPYEVIAWWCLKSSATTKYEYFQQLKAKVVCLKDVGDTNEFTANADILNIRILSEEDLFSYLNSLSGWFRKTEKISLSKTHTYYDKYSIISYPSKSAQFQFQKLYDEVIKFESVYKDCLKLIEKRQKKHVLYSSIGIIPDDEEAVSLAKDEKQKLKNNNKQETDYYKKIKAFDLKTALQDISIIDSDETNNLSIIKASFLESIFGESYNEDLDNKRFQLLNRDSLKRSNLKDVINGNETAKRDYFLVLYFYYYVIKLKVSHIKYLLDYYESQSQNHYAGRADDSAMPEELDYLPSWLETLQYRFYSNIDADEEIDDEDLSEWEDDFDSMETSELPSDFRSLLLNDFRRGILPYLEGANYNGFYLPGSMDSFIFLCLISEDPFDTFRRIINLEI